MWNYRIMKHTEGDGWYGLHEVYYNKRNQICAWTMESLIPARDTVEEIMEELTMMKRDAKKSKDDVLDFDMEPEGDF